MAEKVSKSEWQCVKCGEVLGNIFGGELYPLVPGKNLRTSGPNLEVTCPNCGALKTFYTSDAVVRAMYQLVNAIADVAAKAMVEQVGRAIHAKNSE